MKKILLMLVVLGLFTFGYVKAQQNVAALQVDYQGQAPIDSDLDGLTDQSEIQIYQTDPKNPDTDGDRYYDGAEILANSDSLDANSIPGMPPISQYASVSPQNETPWPWYIARAGGLVGFALLYLSIFLGLTIRVPFLRKIFAPLYALQGHCWIAFQATLFALIHGTVFIFDKFLGFKLVDVFVPFASSYEPSLVALGIIGFYLMVILTASSYGRRFISQKLWRVLHFTNIFLYVFVVIHALYLGTDLKIPLLRDIFIALNEFLVLLMFINMFSRIRQNIARKNATIQNPIN